MQERVIVALSGGVDSAVSAWRLLERGYEVQALFMRNWEESDPSTSPCTASLDLADAQAVCDKLGIVLHTANFATEYWDGVFRHFLAEYAANRTPNPDVLCNREIKFRCFLDHAKMLGADFIATGHYAGIRKVKGHYALTTSRDTNKDQTYFLYTLNQKQLGASLFPLTDTPKPEVRRIATQIGLPNHAKKDSVGICFIGQRRFRSFLKRYLPPKPGLIQTLAGKTLGQHEGLMYYTLGQRQGLGVGGQRGASEDPWYVISKDVPRNVLLVAQGHDHPLLYTQQLLCTRASWIAGEPPIAPFSCTAKIRYRQTATPCTVHATQADAYTVRFESQQWAVTPGQSIVFYQDDICLGGGIIDDKC